MNPNRFFYPGYIGTINNMIPVNPMMSLTNNVLRNPISKLSNTSGMLRNPSFFNRLTNGIRSVNWGGLLNNANKTLNVVNQTIPLVRQAGPMVNNMKNMVRIAKIFGDETSNNKKRKKQIINNQVDNNIDTNTIKNIKINTDNDNTFLSDNCIYNSIEQQTKKEIQNSSSPSFFIY